MMNFGMKCEILEFKRQSLNEITLFDKLENRIAFRAIRSMAVFRIDQATAIDSILHSCFFVFLS